MSAAEYAEALAALTIATADRVRELVEAGDMDGAIRAALGGADSVRALVEACRAPPADAEAALRAWREWHAKYASEWNEVDDVEGALRGDDEERQ